MRRRRVMAGLAIVAIAAVGAGLGLALGEPASTRTHTAIAAATATGPARTITQVRKISRVRTVTQARTRTHVKRAIVPSPASPVASSQAPPHAVPAPAATSVSGLPRWSQAQCSATYQSFATRNRQPSLLKNYRYLLDLQYGCHL